MSPCEWFLDAHLASQTPAAPFPVVHLCHLLCLLCVLVVMGYGDAGQGLKWVDSEGANISVLLCALLYHPLPERRVFQPRRDCRTEWSWSISLHPWLLSASPARRHVPQTLLSRVDGGLPLNNETGNFLCPGNVPLVIHVILISRPQCSEQRPLRARAPGGIIAKCFLRFFLCLEFKAWPLRVEFNQVIAQIPQWGNKSSTGKVYCFHFKKVEMLSSP